MDRVRLVEVHRDLLEQWRTRMNLVGPGPIDIHYTDAEKALEDLPLEGRWADLGTGAGFPGVVLAAMYPSVELDLVDSRQKRCVFLEEVVGRSEVRGVHVHCTRIERLADASYDGIVSRALAAPPAVLDHARRLLRPRGRVILMLQDDGVVPDCDDFEVEAERPYTVGGRARRSVLLRRN